MQWLMLGTLLSTLLVTCLCYDILMSVNHCLLVSQLLKFTEIILKYPNDAITLHSMFSTGITVLDTLPLSLSIYYELLPRLKCLSTFTIDTLSS